MNNVSTGYIVEVINKFVPLANSDIPISDNIYNLVSAYRESGQFICVGEEGKGGIIGVVSNAWFNPEIVTVQELGWWVEPEYRGTTFAIKVLKAFEKEAKAIGASKVMMLSLDSLSPEVLHSMYLRLGYSKLENLYIKEV